MALVVLGGLVACGKGNQSGGKVAPAIPTLTVSPSSTATARLHATPIPKLAEDLRPLYEFQSRYGDAPAATMGRLRIPRIGVDAPIAERVAPRSLDLSNLNPYGPADVIWYNFQDSPKYGGEPGPGKNAIFSGHTDYNYPVRYANNVQYRGPGVFAGVNQLEAHDAIEVVLNGRTAQYEVAWLKQISEGGDWGAIYAAETPEGDALTLITCTGDFNPVTQEYNSRTIVRARRL